MGQEEIKEGVEINEIGIPFPQRNIYHYYLERKLRKKPDQEAEEENPLS